MCRTILYDIRSRNLLLYCEVPVCIFTLFNSRRIRSGNNCLWAKRLLNYIYNKYNILIYSLLKIEVNIIILFIILVLVKFNTLINYNTLYICKITFFTLYFIIYTFLRFICLLLFCFNFQTLGLPRKLVQWISLSLLHK